MVTARYEGENVRVSHASPHSDITLWAIDHPEHGDMLKLDYIDLHSAKERVLNEDSGFIEVKTRKGRLLEMKPLAFDTVCKWNT